MVRIIGHCVIKDVYYYILFHTFYGPVHGMGRASDYGKLFLWLVFTLRYFRVSVH